MVVADPYRDPEASAVQSYVAQALKEKVERELREFIQETIQPEIDRVVNEALAPIQFETVVNRKFDTGGFDVVVKVLDRRNKEKDDERF